MFHKHQSSFIIFFMQNVVFFTTRFKKAKFNVCKNDNFQLYFSNIFFSSSFFLNID